MKSRKLKIERPSMPATSNTLRQHDRRAQPAVWDLEVSGLVRSEDCHLSLQDEFERHRRYKKNPNKKTVRPMPKHIQTISKSLAQGKTARRRMRCPLD